MRRNGNLLLILMLIYFESLSHSHSIPETVSLPTKCLLIGGHVQFHHHSKSLRFLERKERNPVPRKVGVAETGKIRYRGIEYEDEPSLSFLAPKVESVS